MFLFDAHYSHRHTYKRWTHNITLFIIGVPSIGWLSPSHSVNSDQYFTHLTTHPWQGEGWWKSPLDSFPLLLCVIVVKPVKRDNKLKVSSSKTEKSMGCFFDTLSATQELYVFFVLFFSKEGKLFSHSCTYRLVMKQCTYRVPTRMFLVDT